MRTVDFIPIGIAVILIGFILVFLGALLSSTQSKVAVGGFIGPIPFGFANDRRMLYLVMGLAVFMFVMWFLLNRLR